jgi:hypothetical protein
MSLLGGSAWSIDKDGSITTTGTITASAKGIEGKGGTLNLGAASTTITMGNSANTNTIDAEAGTITIGTATGSTPKITIGNNDTGTTLSLTSGKGATSWSVDGTTGKGTFASLEVSPGGTLTVGGGTAITWIAEGTVQCKNGVGTATFPKNAPASPEIVLSADTSNLIVQVTSINPDFSGFSFSCSQLGVTKNKQLNVPSTGLSASSSTITISGTDSKGDSFSGSATPSISVGGSAQTDAFDLVTLDSSAATGKVHYVAMTH